MSKKQPDNPKEITRPVLMSQASHQKTTVQSFSSGPLPPPEHFAGYEKALIGAANRILTIAENEAKERHVKDYKLLAIAEKETEHRHSQENKILEINSRDSLIGIICAFVISVLGIGGGIWAIVKGYPWAGGFISGLNIVGIISAFLKVSGQSKEKQTSPQPETDKEKALIKQ